MYMCHDGHDPSWAARYSGPRLRDSHHLTPVA